MAQLLKKRSDKGNPKHEYTDYKLQQQATNDNAGIDALFVVGKNPGQPED
jgi:hypothetical protein